MEDDIRQPAGQHRRDDIRQPAGQHRRQDALLAVGEAETHQNVITEEGQQRIQNAVAHATPPGEHAKRHAHQNDEQAKPWRGEAIMKIHHQPVAGFVRNALMRVYELADFAGGALGGVLDFVHEILRRFGKHGHFHAGSGLFAAERLVAGAVVARLHGFKPPVAAEPAGAVHIHLIFVGAVRPLLHQINVAHFEGCAGARIERANTPCAAAGHVFIHQVQGRKRRVGVLGPLQPQKLARPMGGPRIEQFIDGQQEK